MKLIVGANVCLALLVGFAVVYEVNAACGDVMTLMPCLPAAKTGSDPTTQCCTSISNFASGPDGESCLCTAVSNPLAASQGAQKQFAILIPQKCGLDYKEGYVCNGDVVPGGHP